VNFNHISIRTFLAGAIFVMGNLAIVLVYISGEVFQYRSVGHEQELVKQLADTEVRNLKRKMDQESQQIVSSLVLKQRFVADVHTGNKLAVEQHLQSQMASYLESPGKHSIRQLYVYDSKLQFVAQSPQSNFSEVLVPNMCPKLYELAVRRAMRDNTAAVAGVCRWEDQHFYATVIPLGDQAINGFIEVISSLIPQFIAQERELNLPIRVTTGNASEIYRSPTFPFADKQENYVVVKTKFSDNPVASPIYVEVARDLSKFRDDLNRTSYVVLIIAGIVTLIVIVISTNVLQKMAVDPITELTYQVGNIRNDQNQLGRKVVAEGNAEVYELSEGFNEMTAKLKESYDDLQRMAFMDPLTKLPNRTLFNDRLEQTILRARRSERAFAVFIMDLDRFKEINDTVGHHVGDIILQQVGVRLLDQLRESDTVARLGGDEFAVLLQSVDKHFASQMAAELLEALKQPFEVNNDRFYISASIGIALHPHHGDNVNALMQKADVAMYEAKNEKKGFTIYNEELDRDSTSRLELMGDLRQAVDIKAFELYYQPKVNLRSQEVEGVEALVRWKRNSFEIASPEVFIPILEQTGQIRSLTQWVLEEALDQYLRWKEQGLNTSIAVNLSTRDLQDPDIAVRISTLLSDKNISSQRLELEITESSMMHDPIRALDILQHLSAMGINITVDDFGTGYSSLAYLKRLPANSVKIDKSFIIGMLQDPNDDAIVRTSVDLAHNLGLKVVAEGVENQDLMTMLSGHGCDSAQGYYISRPLTADDFIAWAKQCPWPLRQAMA
jgi:diguanylate cyclase (GGDEF)-like protein